jgi:hypothetical protein
VGGERAGDRDPRNPPPHTFGIVFRLDAVPELPFPVNVLNDFRMDEIEVTDLP